MPESKKDQSSVGKKHAEQPSKANVENKPVDKKISDLIGPIFESLNIEEGIVIAKMPGDDKISVYFRGHFYDVAALVAGIHRKFKDQIVREID